MNGVSLHWFGKLFSGVGIVDIGGAFKRSLALGLVVMVLTVLFSVRPAWRSASVSRLDALFFVAIASLIMPSIITSLGIALEFRLLDDFIKNRHRLDRRHFTTMGLFTSASARI
jgi:putative spermidine/putrescine transport system permease protein